MFSKFSDAMAQCIAFDHLAEGDALLTADDFRRQLVHFCSLLSAVAMQSLQHEDNLDVLVEEPQAYGGRLYRTQLRARFGEARCDAKVEVLGGVSEAEKQLLKGDGDRAHTVNSCARLAAPRRHRRAAPLSPRRAASRRPTPTPAPSRPPLPAPHHTRLATPLHLPTHPPLSPTPSPSSSSPVFVAGLIRCITVRQREGGVAVPPPILSRVYQELSNAMLGFNSAMKVAESPFPFPYAQLNVIQVWLLVATCPLIVAAFTESSNLSFVLTALTVMGFQGLTEVACDLESPFVSSANELPLNVMHDRFNRQLELLLTPAYISHNYSVLISESDESAEGMAGMAGASGDVPGMVHHSAVARRSYVAEQEAPKRVGGELAA